jgi:hypothetical protein
MHWEATPHQNQVYNSEKLKFKIQLLGEKKVSPLALIQASRKG